MDWPDFTPGQQILCIEKQRMLTFWKRRGENSMGWKICFVWRRPGCIPIPTWSSHHYYEWSSRSKMRVALCTTYARRANKLEVQDEHETHSDDVEEVVIPQCIQNRWDCLLCNGQTKPFHAATDVDQNNHIFGRSCCLDVPRSGWE